MSFDLGKLFIDWRRIVPNGVPNPNNDYHLVLLKEICLARGIDKDVIDNVILTLEKKEIKPDTKITYKLGDKDRETTYDKAIKRDKEHPAYKAAKALQDKESGEDDGEEETEKQSTDFSTDAYADALSSKKDDDIDDSDTETQSQDDKKVKELNQERARNTTKEFNEGELSQDGVSDDDYNNNPNVERVEDPIDIEDIQQHLPNPLPFPKKYLKVFERLLNTKKAGLLITDLTDSAGGGTPESTAGEIMTMILTSVDDDNEAQTLANKILEHTKKTGKTTLIDKTWLKSAMLVRENTRRRYDNQFGEGNWKFKNAAWDIQNEVEALGMEDYHRDKGFSTDVYFNI